MTDKRRKRLLDSLKPETRKAIGKVVDCPKCGRAGAEHYSAGYIACRFCDSPQTKAEADAAFDFEIRDLDEDTNPGWASIPNYQPLPSITRALYACAACQLKQRHRIDDVAAGERCLCGGTLHRCTSP